MCEQQQRQQQLQAPPPAQRRRRKRRCSCEPGRAERASASSNRCVDARVQSERASERARGGLPRAPPARTLPVCSHCSCAQRRSLSGTSRSWSFSRRQRGARRTQPNRTERNRTVSSTEETDRTRTPPPPPPPTSTRLGL